MRNLADVYNPSRLVSRFLNYIKETIIYEFPWLIQGSKSFEIFESKRNRAILSSKQVVAELLTFLVICGFLVVLILLSLKCPKEEEDEIEEEEVEEISPVPVVAETISESSQSSVYSLSVQAAEPNFPQLNCVDSPDISRFDEIPDINLNARNHNHAFTNFSNLRELSETSNTSIRETPIYSPPDRQQLQPKKACVHNRKRGTHHKQQKSKKNDREWMLRRTRSGQIYGKYQF